MCSGPCCSTEWEVLEVPADGDCFFHSLSHLLGDDSTRLRSSICDAAGLCSDHAMRTSGSWFDSSVIDMAIVAKAINAKVSVRNTDESQWQSVDSEANIAIGCVGSEGVHLLLHSHHFSPAQAIVSEDNSGDLKYEDWAPQTKKARLIKKCSPNAQKFFGQLSLIQVMEKFSKRKAMAIKASDVRVPLLRILSAIECNGKIAVPLKLRSYHLHV